MSWLNAPATLWFLSAAARGVGPEAVALDDEQAEPIGMFVRLPETRTASHASVTRAAQFIVTTNAAHLVERRVGRVADGFGFHF
jgi:hypothetical protein